MQIIHDIGNWLSQQPAWLSDCARRLLTQVTLSPDDKADLVALLKVHHGFKDPQGRQPIPVDQSQIPVAAQEGANIRLQALRDPLNLNAIDSRQSLTFQVDGLTVVYGYNGVGKSGYARALKKVCRARNVEDIFPNVYMQSQTNSAASATIEWLESDTEKSANWSANNEAPPALSQISVFDTHCARVFVDSQAKVLFVPGGLEVMHGLADAMKAAQAQLENERATNRFDFTQLSSLAGQHVVGREYAKLGRQSKAKDFEALATFSEQELLDLTTLRKLFSDQDPIKQAEALKRLLMRMSTVTTELTERALPLQDEAINQLREAFSAMVAAEGASKLVVEKLKADGAQVTGTGTEPWEVLFRSAMDFVAKEAYPGYPFPGPEDDSHCVLCQQPLTKEATARLKSFAEFLENDAQRKFAEQRSTTIQLFRAINTLDFDKFPTDAALLEELGEIEPDLVAAVRTYVQALQARKMQIVKMAPERKIGLLTPLPEEPFSAIELWVKTKTAEIATLEKSMTPEERTIKLKLLADLEARAQLRPLLPKVLEAIIWHKRDHAFGEAIRSCGTAALTRKTTELYNAHVTEELRAAFAKELETLGIRNQPVTLEMTGQKGAHVQQLKLGTTPRYAKAKLSAILSEGEQRVVALALFLAEIGIEPGSSGLIFDDPVSSLDHLRREHIAKRLVLEAKKRQVIVFTHDLAFALALTDLAEDQGVKFVHRHLAATSSRKGLCSDDLPFEGKKLKSRIADLRALAARAKTLLEIDGDIEGYNDLVRNSYRRLRDTWEQLVEDALLQSTVRRYRVSVETMRLRSVSVDDSDASTIYNGMTRCSKFTHEGGAEAPPALPDPAEFAADVETLATYAQSLDTRAKATEARRKLAGLGA
ncbi:AAA family ATPase [Alcaligenes faecalis]|uniref:AAA family ATPase n=1 Tax=Alcaligenes faecalis TaxID=511 RepID=A0AAE9KPG9_ALCFA|nr:AAA family ATPase [Alcaligenes faecalis]UPL21006.1 AAA family ATPase [Alcaligenes faecalis]